MYFYSTEADAAWGTSSTRNKEYHVVHARSTKCYKYSIWYSIIYKYTNTRVDNVWCMTWTFEILPVERHFRRQQPVEIFVYIYNTINMIIKLYRDDNARYPCRYVCVDRDYNAQSQVIVISMKVGRKNSLKISVIITNDPALLFVYSMFTSWLLCVTKERRGGQLAVVHIIS